MLPEAVVMRGHRAPRGPWEPTAPPRQPSQMPPYYYFLQSKQPRRKEQVISALSLHLSVLLSLFQYPNKWSALSSPWPDSTPPSCFCGTSTLVFSFFFLLLLPNMAACVVFFCLSYLWVPWKRLLFFTSAGTITPTTLVSATQQRWHTVELVLENTA